MEVIHTTYGLLNYFSFLEERMAQGLGPNVAIVPDPVLPSMIEQKLIEDLESYKLDTSNFYFKVWYLCERKTNTCMVCHSAFKQWLFAITVLKRLTHRQH